ncbi:inner nuclear membrane protein enriched at telomere/subtelomere region [Thecaphora frezii]
MSSSQEYAAEGFDPTSLKMAQLRSILLQHGVAPPSTARKADLVAEFNRHVAPQAAALRSRDASVVASSSGIIDMRAQRTDDSSLENTPVKTPRKTRRSVAASRNQSEAPASPETASAAKAEPEVEVPVKRRRGRPRKSAPATVDAGEPASKEVSFEVEEAAPQSQTEGKAGRLSRKNDDEPAFSDYNPFQSGSEASPNAGVAAKAAAAARRARRKTTDARSSRLAARSDDDEDADLAGPSANKSSDTKLSLPKSRTMPAFKNYMDASIVSSTPPRIIGKALKKGREMLSPARSLVPEDDVKDAGQAVDSEDDDDDDDDGEGAPVAGAAPSRSGTLAPAQPKGRTAKRYTHEDLSTSQKLSQLLWTLILTSLVAYGIWYVRESRTLGYCDTGSTTNSVLIEREAQFQAATASARAAREQSQTLRNDEDDELALAGQVIPNSLRPTCTPCPPHAECSRGALLGCSSQDYVLQSSWLELVPMSSALFPLSWTLPSCVPDTQKLVLAFELASAVNSYVAKWKGDVVCGYEGPHPSVAAQAKKDSRPELRYALPEALIRQAMLESRDVDMISEDYFAQLWELAMEDISAPGSNVVRLSANTTATAEAVSGSQLLAAKAPILTIGCRSRLALRAWLKRTRIYFFAVAAAVLAVTYVRRRWRLAREERQKVNELVQVALERLQEQEYAHAIDPVVNPDPFVPTSHLRDHVLRSEPSTSARQRLWKKVAKVVEENSNVRTRQANKRGEWLRVWEWVGVVGAGMSQVAIPQTASKRVATPDRRGARWNQDTATEEDEMRQLRREVGDGSFVA